MSEFESFLSVKNIIFCDIGKLILEKFNYSRLLVASDLFD